MLVDDRPVPAEGVETAHDGCPAREAIVTADEPRRRIA